MGRTAAAAALAVVLVLMTVLSTSKVISASDPELTTDFFVPEGTNASFLDGNYFTFTGLRNVTPKAGIVATVTGANSGAAGFTALTGLGVSYSLLQYPPGGINRLHTHPRGTELLYVLHGSLYVGLLASDGKLFTQTLQQGDIFVFPKGLIHFQINRDSSQTVEALAAFSSSNAGTITVPVNIFGSKPTIDDDVLAKSFGVSVDVIHELVEAQAT